MANNTDDSYRYGTLPDPALLAVGYVPMQTSASPSYEPADALARGTLFPGLDLPFMNMVNRSAPDTPLTEVMAIDFVADELTLYLDTHKYDTEAFDMLQTFLALSKEAHKRYSDKYGPICKTDMIGDERFTWVNGPWPWSLADRED